MAKTLSAMSVEELQAEIDAVDEEIGKHGEAIQKARKAQRKHLDRKDDLITALNEQIRASGPNLTLGDDRG